MTLVVAISSPHSIWLLTDRRLSYQGRPPKDDARKILFLETTDGVALIGYTGLGETIGGTEPSDWMGRVLRGYQFPLEKSLGILADAAQRQLPRHLDTLRATKNPTHNIIITAFNNGNPQLYSIDLTRPPERNGYLFRFTRHKARKGKKDEIIPPRVALGGSGAIHLTKDNWWYRNLIDLVRAHDNGRIKPQTVAKFLAKINHTVHLAATKTDNSVGNRSIIAWRLKLGGGAHALYEGTENEKNHDMIQIPTIANGMDMNAIVSVSLEHILPTLIEGLNGGQIPEIDSKIINEELSHLPHKPDENLE